MSAFALALLAAVIWGVSAYCEKRGLMGADPLAGLWARCVGVFLGGVIISVGAPQLATRVAQMGWPSFAWIASGGFLASVVGQIFFYRALKIGEIGRVAAVGGSWPLMAFFLSVLLLHETPTLRKCLGVGLVILGVALLK